MILSSMKTYAASLALASAGSFAAGAVQAANLSFDENGAAPCTYASSPGPLDNAYTALGVTFSGGWHILGECGGFGVPALSGSNFLTYNTSVTTNTVTMTFDAPISQISGFLGGSFETDWSITTSAGGPAEVVSNLSSAYVPFSLSGSFTSVSIAGGSSSGVLEDLSFSDIAAVPVPAGGLLLLSAIGGAVVLRRRRRG
ncbi:putative secreted protein [Aliiruegeria haliotis]|uniref:Putative secreted protein n=1 Tax=Aliiruegeria haliotis TaxID=1280846 RepID=A0A2T0RUY3_9RHOB|nr:VPLPA-CTERM sorting domain-containing protein [Aliiruegeria haliotis]PRY25005.1 putative secreted protein [Aliiruegeria haliotis]